MNIKQSWKNLCWRVSLTINANWRPLTTSVPFFKFKNETCHQIYSHKKSGKVNFKSTGLFLRKHNRSICELLQEQASLWGNDKYLCVHAMHHCCTPPPLFCCGVGGGQLTLLPNFQKAGLTGSQFLEWGCWEKRVTFSVEVAVFI